MTEHNPSGSEKSKRIETPRRTIVAGAGVAAMGLLLAACGGKNPKEQSPKNSTENPEVDNTQKEPTYVESGIDPNTVPSAEDITNAHPAELEKVKAELLLQFKDGKYSSLADGVYLDFDEQGEPREIVRIGEDPERKFTINEYLQKFLGTLDLVWAMCQDPNLHIREAGCAMADRLEGDVPMDTVRAHEKDDMFRNQVEFYGDGSKTTNADTMNPGSTLINAIKNSATDPEGLKKIAPWLGKEVSVEKVTDNTRMRVYIIPDPTEKRPNRERKVMGVVAVCSWTNEQGKKERVSLLVQPDEYLNLSNIFDEDPTWGDIGQEPLPGYEAIEKKYQLAIEIIGFEGMGEKTEPEMSVLSQGRTSPDDIWQYGIS